MQEHVTSPGDQSAIGSEKDLRPIRRFLLSLKGVTLLLVLRDLSRLASGAILPFMAEPLMKEAVAPATGFVSNDARFGQYSIIFLLAALNSFLLLMLADASGPFDGFWQVNLGPFQELSEALDREFGDSAPSV